MASPSSDSSGHLRPGEGPSKARSWSANRFKGGSTNVQGDVDNTQEGHSPASTVYTNIYLVHSTPQLTPQPPSSQPPFWLPSSASNHDIRQQDHADLSERQLVDLPIPVPAVIADSTRTIHQHRREKQPKTQTDCEELDGLDRFDKSRESGEEVITEKQYRNPTDSRKKTWGTSKTPIPPLKPAIEVIADPTRTIRQHRRKEQPEGETESEELDGHDGLHNSRESVEEIITEKQYRTSSATRIKNTLGINKTPALLPKANPEVTVNSARTSRQAHREILRKELPEDTRDCDDLDGLDNSLESEEEEVITENQSRPSTVARVKKTLGIDKTPALSPKVDRFAATRHVSGSYTSSNRHERDSPHRAVNSSSARPTPPTPVNQRTLQSLEKANRSLESEKKKLLVEVDRLSRQLEDFQNQIEYDASELQQERWEHDQTRRKRDETQRNINKILEDSSHSDILFGRQEDDEHIRCRYKEIHRSIKEWVTTTFPHDVPDDLNHYTFPDDFYIALDYISPLYEGEQELVRMFSEPVKRRFLVQGYLGYLVWLCLPHEQPSPQLATNTTPSHTEQSEEDLEQSDADLEQPKDVLRSWISSWMQSDVQQAISTVESTFMQNSLSMQQSFHDWRALSMDLLSRASNLPAQHNIVRGTASKIMRQFQAWLPPASSEETLEAEVLDDLVSILQDMISLSQIIRSQRASWTVHHSGIAHALGNRDNSLYLDNDIMIIEPQPKNMNMTRKKKEKSKNGKVSRVVVKDNNVKFVLFPALWKRGNTDGKGYDQISLMFKEIVMCKYQCG